MLFSLDKEENYKHLFEEGRNMEKNLVSKNTKRKLIREIIFFSTLCLLSFLRAVATYVFVVPNGFAPGGIGGIASIIYNAVAKYSLPLAQSWFNPAVTIFVLNAPLLFLALKKINLKFAINTTICVLLYSGFMALMSGVKFPQFTATNAESSFMILAALVGGVLSGISLGFMLLSNASAGGTDVIAKVVYAQNPLLNVQWLVFLFDSIVVLLSCILGILAIEKGDEPSAAFVKILSPIFYSGITILITSKTAEIIHTGVESSVVFNIVTDKPDEVADAIIKKLGRGVTILTGEGVYTHSERKILLCVARKRQLLTTKRMVLALDPCAFVFITNAREVNGRGFTLPISRD